MNQQKKGLISDIEKQIQLSKNLGSIESGMLTIIIEQESSQKKHWYHIATKKLQGTVVGNMIWVIIPDSEVLNNAVYIRSLAVNTAKSYNRRAYFRTNPINLNDFSKLLIELSSCSKTRSELNNVRHCWQSNNIMGWGCKYIQSVKKEISNVAREFSYWYNYGVFVKGKWIIDKQYVTGLIMGEIKQKGLDLCPHLCHKSVLQQISDLPDSIHPDEDNFITVYKEDIFDGLIKRVPFNIKHVNDHTAKQHREKLIAQEIKSIEFQIGMDFLSGEDLLRAKERLLVLRGYHTSYSYYFMMELNPEAGYRYSEN